ncbi:hypothetical protein M9Y10_036212 [Tritrichomonas musculus]|uniref:VPS9 domain-containing protein n=1 Tax=Tritrichomonas musculus TaxID=1915356 RepID=A0ABR2GWA7_9EUKA
MSSKDSTQHFYETGEGFTCDLDWKELRSYLIPFQDDISLSDPQFNQRIINHLTKCRKIIYNAIPRIQEELQEINESLLKDPLEHYQLPEINPANRFLHLKLRFLLKKIAKLTKINAANRIERINRQFLLLNSLIQLIDYLLSSTQNLKRIMIKISRAVEPVDQTIFTITRPKAQLLHLIRRLVKTHLIEISLIPVPFSSASANRNFLREIIDAGVNAKKPGTSYFSELPSEASLDVFFESPHSPLCQKRYMISPTTHQKENIPPLLPYDRTKTDPEYVKNWIFEATNAIIQWLQKGENLEEINEDQEAAISILLERFLFAKTYPLLYVWDQPDSAAALDSNPTPNDVPTYIPAIHIDFDSNSVLDSNSPNTNSTNSMSSLNSLSFSNPNSFNNNANIEIEENDNSNNKNDGNFESHYDLENGKRFSHQSEAAILFAHKMEEFAKQTPEQIGILPKYVPLQCRGKPVRAMFEVDSIARAPVEWLNNAIHHVCPIDAAYCIVKVHESLSVMAVLRATSEKADSGVEDFVEKMPGFDDIFEIWLSLLCVSGIPQPQKLMNFISVYSHLPGFTARVMASIAYLEASLCQLKSALIEQKDE